MTTDLAALVAEVKEALQRASKGPWTLMPIPPASREDHGWRSLAKGYGWMVGIPRDVFLRVKGGIVHRKEAEWKADLDLVAHAPEWLGALVQAVEDLREKLGRANEQNQYCHDNHSPGQQMVIESQTQQLHDLRLEVAQLRADGQRLRELGAQAAFDMVAGLYPGFDRQVLDSLWRAMQDKYGSPGAQVKIAADKAALAVGDAP